MIKPQNESLQSAVRDYVTVAAKNLAERAAAQNLTSDEDLTWLKYTTHDTLAGLPEYRRCVEELNRDSEIAKQLGTMVGTHSRGTRTPTAEELTFRLLDLGLRGAKFDYDAERFEREYEEFERTFYDQQVEHQVIAPLQGLLIHRPVVLSDRIGIVHLNDVGTEAGKSRGDPMAKRVCAVRSTYHLPKVVDEIQLTDGGNKSDNTFEKMTKERLVEEAVNNEVEQVIDALRLFDAENAHYATIIHRSPKWLFSGDHIMPHRVQGSLQLWHDFDEPTVGHFEIFWKRLQSKEVKRWKFLDVAVRRYSYGCERHRTEDKIIDFMIAAEALYLSDVGDKGELSYRLSHRAAFFHSPEAAMRRKVFHHMREAYKLRSAVAHGMSKTMPKLKKENGESFTLEEFVAHTQFYVRAALLKAINLAAHGAISKVLINWDALVLGGNENFVEK